MFQKWKNKTVADKEKKRRLQKNKETTKWKMACDRGYIYKTLRKAGRKKEEGGRTEIGKGERGRNENNCHDSERGESKTDTEKKGYIINRDVMKSKMGQCLETKYKKRGIRKGEINYYKKNTSKRGTERSKIEIG